MVPLSILVHHRIQIKRSPLSSLFWLEDALQGIDWVSRGVLCVIAASLAGVSLRVAASGLVTRLHNVEVTSVLSATLQSAWLVCRFGCSRACNKAILSPEIPTEKVLCLNCAPSGTGSSVTGVIEATAEQSFIGSQRSKASAAELSRMATSWIRSSSLPVLV